MALVVRLHSYADGVPARPDHANANETVLYTVINGNLDWDNITAALVNAASGLVKLDANGDVPIDQIPDTLIGKDADTLDGSELTDITDLISAAVPSGVIVMWSGLLSAIPSGWSLCNGAGSTPDLRDKFIRGAASGADPGNTGGSDSRTLTEANLPNHTHSIVGASSHTHGNGTLAIDSAGSHTHPYKDYRWIETHQGAMGDGANGNDNVTPWDDLSRTTTSAGAHTHTISGSTASGGAHTHTAGATGSGDAFDNRPAYYALAFIMKT